MTEGLIPGFEANIILNHFVGQCYGVIQNDGSQVHMYIPLQTNVYLENNWSHDSPKNGFRFDGKPFKTKLFGTNGTVIANVAWHTNGILLKGD